MMVSKIISSVSDVLCELFSSVYTSCFSPAVGSLVVWSARLDSSVCLEAWTSNIHDFQL